MVLLLVVILWAKTQQKGERNLFSHIKDNETMIMININVINNSLIIAYVISFIHFIIINY